MATEDLKIRILAKDQTKQTFSSVKRGIKALKRAVFSLKGAFIALGVGGIIAAVKETVQFADSIGKTADKLGISTSALQEFRHAARLSGVEIRTFDMAMQRFTRRSAEAAKGTGEAKEALKDMGIQLLDGEGKMRDSSDLMMDVANAFSGVEDESEKLRIAFKLFDSEGAALVNMLNNGSSALQAMRNEAKALGIVMDESLIRSAEEVNDKFTTASQIISIQFKSAILELAPLLMNMAQWMKDVGISFKNWLEMRNLAKINALHSLLEVLKADYANLADGLANTGFRSEQATSVIVAKMKKQKGAIKETADKIVKLDNGITGVTITYGKMGSDVDIIFEHMIESTERLVDGMGNVENAGKESAETFKEEWEKAAKAMTDSMADTITQGIRGFKSLGEVVTDIGNMIANMIIKQTIAKPIATGISGIVSKMDFGFSHSGGIVGRDTPTKVRKFHSGGIAGDEVPAILQKGEMVLTREQQKAVGNQVANITFNVQAFDSQSFQQGMVQNRSIIIGVIQDAFNRNGRAVALA